MQNGAKATLFAVPLALAAAPAVNAAELEARPLDLRLGLSWLQNGSARSIANPTGFSIGVGHDLDCRPVLLRGRGTASFEADFGRHTGSRTHVDALGLYYVERTRLASEDGNGGRMAPYAGIGLGLVFADVGYQTSSGGDSSSISLADSNYSTLRLGGKVVVGVMFGGRYHVEAAYHIGGSAGNVKTDRADVSIGVRF